MFSAPNMELNQNLSVPPEPPLTQEGSSTIHCQPPSSDYKTPPPSGHTTQGFLPSAVFGATSDEFASNLQRGKKRLSWHFIRLSPAAVPSPRLELFPHRIPCAYHCYVTFFDGPLAHFGAIMCIPDIASKTEGSWCHQLVTTASSSPN